MTDVLNLLGKVLSALLNALGQQLLAAIKPAGNTIRGVISFVKSAIALLGEFAAIVRDGAAGPGGWIKKLGPAIAGGIRCLLWGAIKNAVKNWFAGEIQQILGLGQVLQGGMRLPDVLERAASRSGRSPGWPGRRVPQRGQVRHRGPPVRPGGRLAKRGPARVRSLAKRGLRAAMNGIRALGRRLAKTKFGKFLKNMYDKLKAKYQAFRAKLAEWRAKFNKWLEDRKKSKPTPEERLEAAVERIRSRLTPLLKRGILRLIFEPVLSAMRIWYRLSSLSPEGTPEFNLIASLDSQQSEVLTAFWTGDPKHPIARFTLTSSDVNDRWQRGIAALTDFADETKKTGTATEELFTFLVDARRLYDFIDLDAKIEGSGWLLYAYMNPNAEIPISGKVLLLGEANFSFACGYRSYEIGHARTSNGN